jgi:hypothetical protein
MSAAARALALVARAISSGLRLLAIAASQCSSPAGDEIFLLGHDLVRKPVSIPDQVEDMLFGIMP